MVWKLPFFRFFNKEDNKQTVVGTSAISLILSSVGFFILAYLFRDQIAALTNIKIEYISLVIWILLLDALVIIPFAWLRANEKPTAYAIIKIANVVINLGMNLFFLLWLEGLSDSGSLFEWIYRPDFQVNYILISNLMASAFTLVCMIPFYRRVTYTFSSPLWKQMMQYAFPVLIAGIAFSINETFDRYSWITCFRRL